MNLTKLDIVIQYSTLRQVLCIQFELMNSIYSELPVTFCTHVMHHHMINPYFTITIKK